MQSNKSRDTRPEILVRKLLHAAGLRYRIHTPAAPDMTQKLDIVFRPARVAVEVHGCFWHGCPAHLRLPKAHRPYWAAKIKRNQTRDRETAAQLAAAGWQLVVVWEHEDPVLAASRIEKLVRSLRRASASPPETATQACPPLP